MLATAARTAALAARLHAAVLGVEVSRTWYDSNELTVSATITEEALERTFERAKAGDLPFVTDDSCSDDSDRLIYVGFWDRVTRRTFSVCTNDRTATGCAVTMHVSNYDGLDYTRELDTITLDDRLAFASICRRLFA